MRNLWLIGVLMCLLGLVVPTCVIVKNIQFTQRCGGYLKQAADANTVELALERITVAIDYMESHNLTDGYTSVLWKTEDENIGFWYQNAKACQRELEEGLNGSQLEKTNLLMKVRESLLDAGEHGDSLTVPCGISRYPHNMLWGIVRFMSVLMFLCGCIIFCFGIVEYY